MALRRTAYRLQADTVRKGLVSGRKDGSGYFATIGPAGAANAGLLAVAILAGSNPALRQKLQEYRAELADQVRQQSLT